MQNDIILISITKDELHSLINEAVKSAIPQQTKKKKLLTGKELCDSLSISLSTLNNWKSSNKVPYKKLGKRIFYDLEEVIKSMDSGRYNQFKSLGN